MQRAKLKELVLREFGEHFEQSTLKIVLYFAASLGVLILFSLPVYWIAIAPTPDARAWWKYLIALTICFVPAIFLGRLCSAAAVTFLRQETSKAWNKHRDLEEDSRKARFFESQQSKERRGLDLETASSTSNIVSVLFSLSIVVSAFYTGLRYLAVKVSPTLPPERLEIALDILESLDVDTDVQSSRIFEICRQRGVEDDAIHLVLDTLREGDVIHDSNQGGLSINPEKPYLKYTSEAWAKKHGQSTSQD